MLAFVGLWSHALAALLYAGLTGWQLRRQGDSAQPVLAAAFAMTMLWAGTTAAFGPDAEAARLVESLRNLAWLAFMLVLLRRGGHANANTGVVLVHTALMLVLVLQVGLDLLPRQFIGSPRIMEAMVLGSIGLRMITAVGALLLVHHLYVVAAPDARWGIRMATIALAAMWAYDLNLYTVAYLTARWSLELYAIRGLEMALLVPLFAVSLWRNVEWRMRVSRRVTFSSLTLLAVGGYLVTMVAITRAIELVGGDYARVAQITVVFGMTVAALVMLPSGRVRAWAKVKVAKHFFQHRYDYRVEWLRFTETLGVPHEDAAALDVRVVKAIADITESPGGLLLLPDESGGLVCAARWNWNTIDPPAAPDHALAQAFAADTRIVAFDDLRRGAGDAAPMPAWIRDAPRAWAAVPLVHVERLVGVVMLERPRVDRGLDWEDFDLLRVAGRQVASYLAEARGQEALSDARRFDEFNRRFAFIMHDIKNLVSQLGLLARNAERHADNPAFRADMIATLNSSTAKMNDMLARLSQHHQGRAEESRAVALGALVDAVIAPRRGQHPIQRNGRRDLIAIADPQRLEQALGHLIQNAIDASARGAAPIGIEIAARGGEAAITVADRGRGMSAEFLRTRLFKPFASTKEGGFGIGAFEARSLIAGMGGRLDVESREGEGTRFTVVLPLAAEQAARMSA